jgi:cytochrome c556
MALILHNAIAIYRLSEKFALPKRNKNWITSLSNSDITGFYKKAIKLKIIVEKNMQSKFSLSLSACILIIMTTLAGADNYSNSELKKATAARHSQMQMIAYHTGLLSEMAKGSTAYNADLATAAAENLATVASMKRITLWLIGSEQGAIAKSRAKSEIWSDSIGFEKTALAFEAASNAMIIAAGQNVDTLRTAMSSIGKSCQSCHESYRGPKN